MDIQQYSYNKESIIEAYKTYGEKINEFTDYCIVSKRNQNFIYFRCDQ